MEDQELLEEYVETDGDGKRSGSLFEDLKRRRDQIGEERSILIDIPGYNGHLVARYKMVEWSQMRRIFRRMDKMKGDARELYAMCDVLITCCDELLYREKPDGEPQSLEEGRITRYDDFLAANLGFEAPNARAVVLGVFKNDLALAAHHSELVDWLQSSREDVDEEALGE